MKNISEVKLVNFHKFWEADHQNDDYDCWLALLTKVWCGSELVHF